MISDEIYHHIDYGQAPVTATRRYLWRPGGDGAGLGAPRAVLEVDIETRFDALREGLERDRSALEAELDQAQAALASSRREVQQWRAHGSRVLEAMQQAQRLADQSGATARELDSYLERSSRLFDPRVPDLGTLAGSSVATPGERVSVFRRQCSSLLGAGRFTSREVRFAAALPLLIGALASAKVMWDTRGDAPLFEASDQQAQHARGPQGEGALIGVEGDAGMLAAALTGPVDARVAREARAALAAFEPVSPAGRGQTDFDPRVQRQQHDLLALGFDLGHSRADGVMGARTQQALGPVQQSRADVVAGQFQMGVVDLVPRQTGAGKQVLVNAYGPVNLTALAQQVAIRAVALTLLHQLMTQEGAELRDVSLGGGVGSQHPHGLAHLHVPHLVVQQHDRFGAE